MRVISRAGGRGGGSVEWFVLLPGQSVVKSMRLFFRVGFDQGPVFQIEFLFIAEKFLRLPNSLFLCKRHARRFFRKRMPDRMERSIWPKDDSELFRLSIAEVAHAPESSRDTL